MQEYNYSLICRNQWVIFKHGDKHDHLLSIEQKGVKGWGAISQELLEKKEPNSKNQAYM